MKETHNSMYHLLSDVNFRDTQMVGQWRSFGCWTCLEAPMWVNKVSLFCVSGTDALTTNIMFDKNGR